MNAVLSGRSQVAIVDDGSEQRALYLTADGTTVSITAGYAWLHLQDASDRIYLDVESDADLSSRLGLSVKCARALDLKQA